MRIAGWISGILVILLALSILSAEQMIAGSIFLVAGVVALPPFRDKVNKRREADGKSPISAGFSLIPAGCLLIVSCVVLVGMILDPGASVRRVQRGPTPQEFDHRFNGYMDEEGAQPVGVVIRSHLADGKMTKSNNDNVFLIEDNSMLNQGMFFLSKVDSEGILTEVMMVRNAKAAEGVGAVTFSILVSSSALSGIIEAFDSIITEGERQEIVKLLIIREDFCEGKTHNFTRSGVRYWSSCLPNLGTISVGAVVVE